MTSFRGPAPLHHTLLAGETHTGVTLQTLHPERFDHGAILAQTPPLKIPDGPQCTYKELLDFVIPKAAEILVQGIRKRLFISDPNRPPSIPSAPESDRPLRHAPKITTRDRHIEWAKWTTEDLLRRDRVLGRLWSFCQAKGKPQTRIILEGFADVTPEVAESQWFDQLREAAGTPCSQAQPQPQSTRNLYSASEGKDPEEFFLLPLMSADHQCFSIPCAKRGDAVLMCHPNGDAVLVEEITVEGGKKKAAAKVLDEWSRSGEVEALSII